MDDTLLLYQNCFKIQKFDIDIDIISFLILQIFAYNISIVLTDGLAHSPN